MEHHKSYDAFPARIVLICNSLSVAIYGIGIYVLSQLWIWLIVPYLIYSLGLEIRLLRSSCVNCYYYGKACAFGRGRLCALLFKKGDPQKFTAWEISWLSLLPDFMVSLIPIVGGIVLLVTDFSWLPLALVIVLVALSTAGNGIIRGAFACKYCKQRELGCPAERLFNKGKRS
ncbi:MAG: hypothetical protein FJZ95_10445 [Chloroflexi bacterium]|nr:hypothetical protein [Chloroflexota bacterium]